MSLFAIFLKFFVLIQSPNLQTSRKQVCMCKEHPLTPHFLYSKTGGLQGYTFSFLFLLQNIDCGYWLEPPQ